MKIDSENRNARLLCGSNLYDLIKICSVGLCLIILGACSSVLKTQTGTVPPFEIVTTVTKTITPKPVFTRTVTDEPTTTFTAYPFMLTGMVEPTISTFKYHKFDPARWEFIPGSENMPDHAAFKDPNNVLWIEKDDQLYFYGGNTWGKLSIHQPDCDMYFLEDMDPDGTLWIEARYEKFSKILRVKDNQITVITPPGEKDHISLASDKRKGAWVMFEGTEEKPKRLFHLTGMTWEEVPLPEALDYHAYIIISDSLGSPWINDYTRLLRLSGKTWREYKVEVYWLENLGERHSSFRVTSENDGSMWVMRTLNPYIFHFFPDGTNVRYPEQFLSRQFGFYPYFYIDRQKRLWFAERSPNNATDILTYWDGINGHSFVDLPFSVVYSVLQSGDKYLIQTGSGWFWYSL